MKIEILNSAKGNEQKQSKRTKSQIPNPQNPGSPTCQEKTKQEKAALRLRYIPSKSRKQPSTFMIIYISINNV